MVNKQYPFLENSSEEGKWGVVDNLDIKLVGSEIHILSLDHTGEFSPYIGTENKRVLFRILDINPKINIPEGLFFNERSIDVGKNHPLVFENNFF